MKKRVGILAIVLISFILIASANANLIQNPGFEINNAWSSPANFANWNEYGNYGITSYSHSGSYAARLGDNTDYTAWNPGAYSSLVSDKFDITEPGLYEFGAWFALKSAQDPTLNYNNDRPGVTTNLYFTDGTSSYPNLIYDISGAPETFWTYYANPHYGYLSNWIFIGGTFNITKPVLNGELNIFIQNWDTIVSTVYVDDAIVQRVPEPTTMLLLGLGLVGLAGIRRKFQK